MTQPVMKSQIAQRVKELLWLSSRLRKCYRWLPLITSDCVTNSKNESTAKEGKVSSAHRLQEERIGMKIYSKITIFILQSFPLTLSLRPRLREQVQTIKNMVAVAQLVEPLIVIQVVAGSSPVGRPILRCF